MSKKHKKGYKDWFDISVEEQMANAEYFNDMAEGRIPNTDVEVYDEPKHVSDLTRQIEASLFGITTTTKTEVVKQEVKVESTPAKDDNQEYNTVEVKTPVRYYEPTQSINTYDTKSMLNRITVREIDALGKIIINDGYFDTVIDIGVSRYGNIDEQGIPEDERDAEEMIRLMYNYIICTKAPSIIVTKQEFEDEFKLFSSVSNNIIAFECENDVCIYILEDDFKAKFFKIIRTVCHNIEDTILFLHNSIYACKNIHCVFRVHDDDSRDDIMSDRHDLKAIIDYISNDPNTNFSSHDYGSVDPYEVMHVIEYNDFYSQILAILSDLEIEEDDDEDEEEYGNIDEINMNEEFESTMEYMANQYQTETNEVDEDEPEAIEEETPTQVHIETTETVKTIETINTTPSNDNGDMTVKVQYRKK